jgi:hypothetical protein
LDPNCRKNFVLQLRLIHLQILVVHVELILVKVARWEAALQADARLSGLSLKGTSSRDRGSKTPKWQLSMRVQIIPVDEAIANIEDGQTPR